VYDEEAGEAVDGGCAVEESCCSGEVYVYALFDEDAGLEFEDPPEVPAKPNWVAFGLAAPKPAPNPKPPPLTDPLGRGMLLP
jgi:hypothetical protein